MFGPKFFRVFGNIEFSLIQFELRKFKRFFRFSMMNQFGLKLGHLGLKFFLIEFSLVENCSFINDFGLKLGHV